MILKEYALAEEVLAGFGVDSESASDLLVESECQKRRSIRRNFNLLLPDLTLT
jgi:hypothetical protein